MSVNVRLLVVGTVLLCGACRESGRDGKGAGRGPEAIDDAPNAEGLAEMSAADSAVAADALLPIVGDAKDTGEATAAGSMATDAAADHAVVLIDGYAVPEAVQSAIQRILACYAVRRREELGVDVEVGRWRSDWRRVSAFANDGDGPCVLGVTLWFLGSSGIGERGVLDFRCRPSDPLLPFEESLSVRMAYQAVTPARELQLDLPKSLVQRTPMPLRFSLDDFVEALGEPPASFTALALRALDVAYRSRFDDVDYEDVSSTGEGSRDVPALRRDWERATKELRKHGAELQRTISGLYPFDDPACGLDPVNDGGT